MEQKNRLWRIRALQDFKIGASDGDLGRVYDCYFDAETWMVRYLVVDTSQWLTGRLILLPPMAVRRIDGERSRVEVALTKSQVYLSPDIDVDKPVSRQQEIAFYEYYAMAPYWSSTGLWGGYPLREDQAGEQAENTAGNPHLHSAREVLNYSIEAMDEAVGQVADFIFQESSWRICYLGVDVGRWWKGRKLLLPPRWIKRVSWRQEQVVVRLPSQLFKAVPDWDPYAAITPDYELRLASHYSQASEAK